MSNKTPVQWLVEQLGLDATTDYLDEIQQALQMEKEQIIDAYVECWMYDGGNPFRKVKENAQQYYNETYGETKN